MYRGSYFFVGEFLKKSIDNKIKKEYDGDIAKECIREWSKVNFNKDKFKYTANVLLGKILIVLMLVFLFSKLIFTS